MFPRGLVPLEELVDFNDVGKNPKIELVGAEVEECNIGTKNNPKILKWYESLPPKEKQKYVELLRKFFDVFSWSYEDLKSYDTSIIEHTIPMREDQNSSKQKLRRVNPVLLPLIEKEVKKNS